MLKISSLKIFEVNLFEIKFLKSWDFGKLWSCISNFQSIKFWKFANFKNLWFFKLSNYMIFKLEVLKIWKFKKCLNFLIVRLSDFQIWHFENIQIFRISFYSKKIQLFELVRIFESWNQPSQTWEKQQNWANCKAPLWN